MEHRKHEEIQFGMDIINILDAKVQLLVEDYWNNDPCPPEFWVSLNNEDENNQEILITINHLNNKFTERLFPRKNTDYGYDSLINQMVNMYNRTM